jgi:hypothetical protein
LRNGSEYGEMHREKKFGFFQHYKKFPEFWNKCYNTTGNEYLD